MSKILRKIPEAGVLMLTQAKQLFNPLKMQGRKCGRLRCMPHLKGRAATWKRGFSTARAQCFLEADF